MPVADTRIVYGATCTWWDSIDKAAARPSGLPCCPHCGGVLFQMSDVETWWEQVDAREVGAADPGYRRFVKWLRGQCFTGYDEARAVFASRKG